MGLTARSVIAALRPGFALTLTAKQHTVEILTARERRFHLIHFTPDGRTLASPVPLTRMQLLPALEATGFPLGSRYKSIKRSDERNFSGFEVNPALLDDEQRAAQHAAVKKELQRVVRGIAQYGNL